MFKSISNKYIKLPSFIIIALFNLALFFISIHSLYRHFTSFQKLEKKYNTVEKTTLQSLRERKEKANFLNEFKSADKAFITSFFENKKNLLEEQNNLKYLSQQPFFHRNDELKSRLEEISKNSLEFYIKELNQTKDIKEKEIILKYPVKCSCKDLNEILTRIGGRSNDLSQKPPQIIPCDVYVEFNESDCTFACKLLQREFD